MPTSSADRAKKLNNGSTETKNLMEIFSIDLFFLMQQIVPALHIPESVDRNLKITKKMQVLASCLYEQFDFSCFFTLMNHPSDIARGISCYLLALHKIPFAEKLALVRPLANDENYGVREWAWIALRKNIAENIIDSIMLLQSWARDESHYIRRFASESTRPRGVWSVHIRELRSNPWYGLPILEQLKTDPTRYVQLSVGNWLNDAGKDHPSWVQTLCKEWLSSSSSVDTAKICRRALRNIQPNRS
ncbi:MAG: DNA alkylation repair protein [Chlamydia sp.]